jgi:hypothetical protein
MRRRNRDSVQGPTIDTGCKFTVCSCRCLEGTGAIDGEKCVDLRLGVGCDLQHAFKQVG